MNVRLLLLSVLLHTLSVPTQAFENVVGAEAGNAATTGEACRSFGPNSSCVDDHATYRIYYGARFTPKWEIRITFSTLNVRLTDLSNAIFNSPAATTYVTSVAGIYQWPVSDWFTFQAKGGLGFWEETNGLFFGGDTASGAGPVFGAGAEFGRSLARFTVGADIYPFVGDGERITLVSAGVRFVW